MRARREDSVPADIEIDLSQSDDDERAMEQADMNKDINVDRIRLVKVPSETSPAAQTAKATAQPNDVRASPDHPTAVVYLVLWVLTIGVFVLSKTIPRANITHDQVSEPYKDAQKTWQRLNGPRQQFGALQVSGCATEDFATGVVDAQKLETSLYAYDDLYYKMVLNVTLDLGVPTVGNISKTIYLKLEHTGQALPIDVNMGKVIPITDEHLTHTSAHPDMFRRNPTAADVRRTSGGERASRRTRERVIGRAREHTRAMSREGMLRERDMGYRVFRARAREMRQAHDTPPADAETAQPGLELRVLAHSCVQVNSTDNANGPAVWTLTTFNSTSNGTGCRPNHWGYWANERLYRDVTNTTRDIFEKALEDATTDGTHENVQIVVTTVLYVRHTLDPEIQINAMDTELWMTAEEKDHVADKLHTLAVKCLAITCLFTVVIIMYRHRKKRQRRAYHGLQSQLVFEEQNAFSAGTQ